MSETRNHSIVRSSGLGNFLYICVLILLGAGLLSAQAGKKPLNEKEILELLQNGVASARVAELANQQGVKVSLTLETERKLRAAGADDELIATLRKLTEPPRPGTVTVETNPGECEVYIDDEPLGTTSPKGRLRLPAVVPGKHQLRITHKGFQTSEQEFDIGEGEAKSITVSLSVATGTTTTAAVGVAEPRQITPGIVGAEHRSGGGTPSPQPGNQNASMKVVAGDFTIEVQSCTMAGTAVKCRLLITNNGDDKQFHLHGEYGRYASRIFDESGNEYTASLARLGNQESDGFAGNILVKGIPMNAELTFGKVSPEMTQIVGLIIGCWDGRENYTLKLRNVPLVR